MRISLRRTARRSQSWIWHSAVALVLLVQCWIAAAPLAECRGVGMSAHVESAGDHEHFTHNEASCVACVVLALRATTPTVDRVAVFSSLAAQHTPAITRSAYGKEALTQRTRAPPTV